MDHSDQGSARRRSSSELCLVLVGSIGCGKTLTADTLLGQSSTPGPSALSRVGQVRRGLVEGRRLTVVETPRWYWRGKEVEVTIQEETHLLLSSSVSGPFILLILIPIGEFTEMERRIPDQLERMFGPSVLRHALVLLTCGEYLMGRSLQEYLRKEEGLREVLRRCGGRCHVISNRRPEDGQQVVTLLEKVEQTIQTNGGFHLVPDQETTAERHMMMNGGIRQTQINTFDQRFEETGGEVMEGRGVGGLRSQRQAREETRGPRTPPDRTFKLTKEGALLSQMVEEPEEPEVQRSQSFINTVHHRIEKGSEVSESVRPASPSDPSGPSLPELRLLLLGRRGSGKSAVGNLLLGREAFELHPEDVPGAERCVRAEGLLQDARVSVVDTPDWFQSERSPEEVTAQISSCVSLLAPGPHVFLLCVPVDRPAHPDLLGALEGTFGAGAVRWHTLVLFTRSDLLEGATAVEQVEAHIASRRPEMLQLVQRCGDRYHILHSGGAKELLEKVQQTLKESGGHFYSCPPLQQEITALRRERQSPARPLDALKEEEEEEVPSPLKSSHQTDSAPAASALRSGWVTATEAQRRVPKLMAAGAAAGAALGVFLAGAVGGAVGAAIGALLTGIGGWRFGKQKTQ